MEENLRNYADAVGLKAEVNATNYIDAKAMYLEYLIAELQSDLNKLKEEK